MEKQSIPDIKLNDLDITVLSLTKFKKAGIHSLADIVSHSESDIAILLNSKGGFQSLVEEMKKYNVRFKPLF